MTRESHQLKLILILSDGIRGHLNQSRGVAAWLAEAADAEILEAEIPALSGAAKLAARLRMRRLLSGNRRDAREWLVSASGEALLRKVGQWFGERGLSEGTNEVLILSVGSLPAPYNLALSHVWRCVCATIMTPSVIGTEFFDFAVVPEHDCPKRGQNIFVTLGSPNAVNRHALKKEAERLLAEYPSFAKKKWSLLIGGDDSNYVIDAEWIRREAGLVFKAAEKEGASVYVTTSRRTSKEAEAALAELIAASPSARYILYASKSDFNPIPAMLGFSDEVFCTDDSVNMVSETVTGGRVAVLMRAGRRKGVKSLLQKATSALVLSGALPRRAIWGVPKFDALYDHFTRHGVLIAFEAWLRGRKEPLFSDRGTEPEFSEFNEARRAADWILLNWPQI